MGVGASIGGFKREVKVRLRSALSARTAQANTPESDLMPEVMHLVSGCTDGKDWEVRLMAECPMTALEKVDTMPEAEFQALVKASEERALQQAKQEAEGV